MNKKSLLCIILTITAAIGLMMVRDSAAWLNTKSGEALPQTFILKKMKMDFEGTLDSYLEYTKDQDFIVSGENLIWDNDGKITGVNYSDLDTQVRFRILYDTPSESETVFTGSSSDLLTADVDSNWVRDGEYFYRTFTATTTAQEFDILSNIRYVDASALRTGDGSAFEGSVRVELQAKQKDNVDWTDIWSTGTP